MKQEFACLHYFCLLAPDPRFDINELHEMKSHGRRCIIIVMVSEMYSQTAVGVHLSLALPMISCPTITARV